MFSKYLSKLVLKFMTKLIGLKHNSIYLSNGIKMHYVQTNNKSTDYVVCVHGFAGSWHHWLYLAELLSSRYNLIMVDLSGFGNSSINWGYKYTIENQSALLNELLDQIDVKQYHLIGNSMGGWICQHHAIQYPEKIKSLVLINSAGVRAENSDLYKEFDARKNPMVFKEKSKFNQLMYWFFENKPFLYDTIKPYFVDMHVQKYEQYKKIFNDFWYVEPELSLEQIECPTLIVWGKQDKCIDVSVANKTYDALHCKKQFEFVNNSGHLPMIERPFDTAKIVNSFLKKV